MALEKAQSAEQLLELNGRYRQLYDKQYRFERDRFINPGEDFTPEPTAVAVPRAGGQARTVRRAVPLFSYFPVCARDHQTFSEIL